MQDMEQTTDTAVTEDQKARRRIARAIAQVFWTVDFKKANPDADKAAIKAAWGSARREKTKAALTAMRRLEKSGFQIVTAGGKAT